MTSQGSRNKCREFMTSSGFCFNVISSRQSGAVGLARKTCTQAKRFGDDAEDLRIVDLTASALAARTDGGQNHVFAGMNVGIDHGGQIAEPEHRARHCL